MKRFNLMIVLLLPSLYSIAQSNPKLAIKVYKRDTLFNCIAADSLGNVYTASSQKGVFKFDGTVWKDWTGGSGAAGVRKSFMKHMAGGREGVWLTHSGYVLTVTGGGSPPISYNNANGGVEYIPAAHPAQRVKYQGRPIIARSLVKGPATKSGLAIAIDKNGTVWSGTNYADSQRYYFYDGFTVYPDRYYYSPGGLTYKTAGSAGFDTVVAGMPWPAGINISIGTDNQTENWSIGKRRTVRAVGVLNSINEVWASVDSLQAAGQTFSNCILRYSLAGAYLGKIDNTGTGLPMGPGTGYAGATSIYEDAKGRIWLGFGNKGLGVKDSTGNWTYIPAPPLLPANTQIRPNAITGNKNGEVYFGTTNGLYVYRCVKGNYTQDSSYKLFTVADSLPSNNILGVTIDKAGSIWLATSSGVARVNKGNLTIFNVNGNNGNITDQLAAADNKFLISTCGDCKQTDTIKVAADSSEATQFEFEYGGDPAEIKFKIAYNGNIVGADEESMRRFGYFMDDPQKKKYENGKIKWLYHHPVYTEPSLLDADKKGITIDFEIEKNGIRIDYKGDGTKQKLRIVQPPILLLHGVWSSGYVFWDPELQSTNVVDKNNTIMYFLQNAPLYKYELYMMHNPTVRKDYKARDERTMQELKDMQYVDKEIATLLATCREKNMSAGKVDIIGHSRGGLQARHYSQYSGNNNVNKIITLNTPHSGSQSANILFDTRKGLFGFRTIGEGAISRTLDDNDHPRGAIDLRVCADFINNLNAPANLANEKVPSHAIATKFKFGNVTMAQFLSNSHQTGKIPYFMRFIGLITKNVSAPLADAYVEKIYGEDNDLVVPYSSQLGGLNPGSTATLLSGNISHSNGKKNKWYTAFTGPIPGVTHEAETHNELLRLLLEKSTNTNLFVKGFNPPRLEYKYNSDVAIACQQIDPGSVTIPVNPGSPATDSTVTVTIVKPIRNSSYRSGDTIDVEVRGSLTVKALLIGFEGYSTETSSDYFDSAIARFKYIIPKEAIGRIVIDAMGANADADFSDDTLSFNIGAPASAVLNSITIVPEAGTIVRKNDSTVITVLGNYSDTIRDITYENGIAYNLEEGNAASAKYGIKGIKVGLDRLFVTYQGKRDTAYVEVVDAPIVINPVPVTFNDIYALYRNGRIEVNWSTASEINNKEFEVQRSIDGTRFETFATVPGKTFSSNTSWYNAPDYNFSNGRNFYRIKQVDLDGDYKYSKVVLVLVKDKSTVLLYPNPARSEVNIVLSASANAGAVRLVNTLGQQVLLKQVTSNRQTVALDISQLQTGVYFTEVLDKNNKRIWGGVFVKE